MTTMLQRVGRAIRGVQIQPVTREWCATELLEKRTLLTGTWILDVTYETGIRDGTSNTVLFAEKYVRTEQTRQITIVEDL